MAWGSRAVHVAGAAVPAQGRHGWRWTPAPHDELHNIAFLKRILPRAEPGAETEAEAVAGWGHDSTPQLAGLTPLGPWGGSQHSSQSLFLALSWVLGWNPALLLHSGQMEEESPYSFSPANFICSGGQDGGLCFVSLLCCSAMHWRFCTECWQFACWQSQQSCSQNKCDWSETAW